MNGPCSFIFHRKLLNSRFWPEKLIATVGVGRDDPWMPGDFNPMWSPAWETRGHQTAWELGNPQDEMSSVYATLPKNSHSQQSDWSKMMTATSWLDIDQITPSKATRKENGRPLESFGLQKGSDHQRSQRISPGERVTVGDRGPSEEMTRIGQSVMDQALCGFALCAFHMWKHMRHCTSM